ncbi:PAS domain-containing sensor histidine kinase [Paracoccus sp. P2]|uniref:sensor histidine kinase n=1 Tax=Paracoccus sp. P2 TaxID=3248840 RepID=UPI00391F546E
MTTSHPLRRASLWVASRLQRRVMVTLALVLICLSALFLILVAGTYRARIASEQERASMQINSLLQAALENAMLKRDLPGLHAIIDDLGRDPNIVAVRILNPDLETRFASDPALEGTVLDLPEVRLALESRKPQAISLQDSGVERSINPVLNQDPCQVCHGPMADHPVNGLLVVDYATGALDAEARQTVLALASLGLAVIGATLLASWLVLRRTVVAPLRLLEQGTERLAAGDLAHRIAVQGADEPARLADSFNQMAGRLDQTVQRLDAAGRILQALIDAIPDGIRVIGPDYRVLQANAAFARHAGLRHDQIIGHPCHVTSHHRDRPCPETLVLCPLVEARAARLPLTCRQMHQGPAGERHVEVAAAAIAWPGPEGTMIPAVVESIRDLDLQAKLSQEQRLSELGLLAAGLAHEIHNPLSSISLLLEAAEADLAAGSAPEATQRLRSAETEVQRTLKMTNSLLSLCMPPATEAVLLDIDRIVPEALSILTFQARQTGCTLQVDIAPGLRLLGSDSDLRMLVTNLALNAFHAMPKGGTVQVRGWRDGADVALSIADQGIGIAPEDQSRIFLPFWTRRADGSPGRGLGLSIVQAIVTRWGGRIAVQSQVGVGTTFIVHWPDPDAVDARSPSAQAIAP